jgi:uncharacterized membrane protein
VHHSAEASVMLKDFCIDDSDEVVASIEKEHRQQTQTSSSGLRRVRKKVVYKRRSDWCTQIFGNLLFVKLYWPVYTNVVL